MKIERPFIQLPVRFDDADLAAEVRALPPEAWVPHPSQFESNEYVPLVTPSGIITNEFAGPMAPTRWLEQCPYLTEVLAALDCVWGRTRLMGLGAGASVPPHVDTNYYWRTHVRMHIPIITNPEVSFRCGEETIHMAPGECWVFDTFREHTVLNGGGEARVHLVADTLGGERLWDLIESADRVAPGDRILLAKGTLANAVPRFEQANYPTVMNPWELRGLIEEVLSHAVAAPPLLDVSRRLDRLAAAWQAVWAEHEDRPAGNEAYRILIGVTQRDLNVIGGGALRLDNGLSLYQVLQQTIFENAVESDRVIQSKAEAAAAAGR